MTSASTAQGATSGFLRVVHKPEPRLSFLFSCLYAFVDVRGMRLRMRCGGKIQEDWIESKITCGSISFYEKVSLH